MEHLTYVANCLCLRRAVEDTDRALRRNDRAGRMTTSLNVCYLGLVLTSNGNIKPQNISSHLWRRTLWMSSA